MYTILLTLLLSYTPYTLFPPSYQLSTQSPKQDTQLSIIPRLIKNMIPMPSNTLSLEQIREPETREDLAFMDEFVSVFWLADDKFTDLCFTC